MQQGIVLEKLKQFQCDWCGCACVCLCRQFKLPPEDTCSNLGLLFEIMALAGRPIPVSSISDKGTNTTGASTTDPTHAAAASLAGELSPAPAAPLQQAPTSLPLAALAALLQHSQPTVVAIVGRAAWARAAHTAVAAAAARQQPLGATTQANGKTSAKATLESLGSSQHSATAAAIGQAMLQPPGSAPPALNSTHQPGTAQRGSTWRTVVDGTTAHSTTSITVARPGS
eukprot:scaffold25372_cov21-Tisochrysis_lutea.AAC.1